MKIFIAAGTRDGRELAFFLLEKNFDVVISVTSEYGRKILQENLPADVEINSRPLPPDELEKFLLDRDIKIFVDASHPFAENISTHAIDICKKNSINYIRYERPAVYSENVIHVADYFSAAVEAKKFTNIFLTTGSKTLQIFVDELKDRNIIARVLPTPDVIQKCLDLGLQPKNIVAMQGKFTKDLNRALFENYSADVVITKESGEIGGVDTKIDAANELGIPVIMIDRPKIDYPTIASSFDEVLKIIEGGFDDKKSNAD